MSKRAAPPPVCDYVVVGAGSAGCAMAARLSEDPSVRVVLLEAGGETNGLMVRMPAGVGELILPNKHNWAFDSEPEATLGGRTLYFPRGKGLGGSSAINAMIYVRGQAADYDRWAQMGLKGWDWDGVLPYFTRSEDNLTMDGPNHGRGGPLTVTDASSGHPILSAFVEAGVQAGHTRRDDFNDGEQEGVGFYQFTIRDAERCSTARAFLTPEVRARENLHVVTHAQGERVLFDGGRAVGVRYDRKGTTQSVRVRGAGEVILCAGAVGSPHLLQLSGVGPADHLRQHGVDVVADRPEVGANMQDHVDYYVQYDCPQAITYQKYLSLFGMGRVGVEYLLNKSGPGASIPVESGGFIRSEPHIDFPDIQLQVLPRLMKDHSRQPIDGGQRHGYLVHVTTLRPESTGTVRLKTTDPLAPAAISLNYFATENDRRVMREGVRRTREICAQPALAPYTSNEIWPGAEKTSDEAMDAHIQANCETNYHPVGTCRMGTDERAVCDAGGRVRGVRGLRVADASIMPKIVSGNTNAPSIMIGEKIADAVKADRRASVPERDLVPA